MKRTAIFILTSVLVLSTTWIAFLLLAGLTGLHAGMETKIWLVHGSLTVLGALVTGRSPIETAVGGPAKLIAYLATRGKDPGSFDAIYRLAFVSLQIVFTPLATLFVSTLVQSPCDRAARHLQ